MRVLVVTSNYPSEAAPASGLFIQHQVAALRRLGVAADVFHVLNGYRWPLSLLKRRKRQVESRVQDAGGHWLMRCPARFLPGALVGPDWWFRLFHRRVNRRLAEVVAELKPEVLHFHFGRSLGYGRRAMRDHPGVARVLTSHGMCTRTSRQRPAYARLMRKAFARADRVILVSEKLRRDAIELGFDDSNLVVIGNGIETGIIRPKDAYWSPGCGRTFRISAVGNLVPLKGHDDTIRAVAMLTERGHDVRLDIVGRGPEMAHLRELADGLGLGDRVTLHGALPNPEALDIVFRSDVLCVPSWSEGFGVVYIEAMAVSVPPIACRGQGIEPVLAESGAGFLVDPHSPEQIAATIERLITEDGLAARLGDAGRDFVAAGYTIDGVCRRIVGVYEEAVAESMRRGPAG